MAKAVLLLSGGLDSTLAGKILMDMGVEVVALNFVSPFCQCTPKSLGCSAAKKAADQLGISVHVHASGEDYIEVIKNPRFGRGSGMNPCLDCRIYSFVKAHDFMKEKQADFIATGEVIGQRPMSQRRDAMNTIDRVSGLSGLVVRPLCAGLLKTSKPELDGIIDRGSMLSIQGRCRQPQMELAEEFGIRDYLCPAGGCLLTDPEFVPRMKDLFECEPDFGLVDTKLLKFGRHFRMPGGMKAIVGRNEQDNNAIERFFHDGDVLLIPHDVPGPSVLCRGSSSEEDIRAAAALAASYTKGGQVIDIEVHEYSTTVTKRMLTEIAPSEKEKTAKFLLCAANKINSQFTHGGF
ncbi:hypothetical protein ACFL60_05660 [Candidatus Omnitrophota bacterium]